jgi:hypothetical protein
VEILRGQQEARILERHEPEAGKEQELADKRGTAQSLAVFLAGCSTGPASHRSVTPTVKDL